MEDFFIVCAGISLMALSLVAIVGCYAAWKEMKDDNAEAEDEFVEALNEYLNLTDEEREAFKEFYKQNNKGGN